MKRSSPDAASDPESAGTGLPLFRTWPGVYLLVVGSFVLWLALLVALTETFS